MWNTIVRTLEKFMPKNQLAVNLSLSMLAVCFATPVFAQALPGGGDPCADKFDANVTDIWDPRYCPDMLFVAAANENTGVLECRCPSAEAARRQAVAPEIWAAACPTFQSQGLVGSDLIGASCNRHWTERNTTPTVCITDRPSVELIINRFQGRPQEVIDAAQSVIDGIVSQVESGSGGDPLGAAIECHGAASLGLGSPVWSWLRAINAANNPAVEPLLDNP